MPARLLAHLGRDAFPQTGLLCDRPFDVRLQHRALDGSLVAELLDLLFHG
jgi:hypothetical protein